MTSRATVRRLLFVAAVLAAGSACTDSTSTAMPSTAPTARATVATARVVAPRDLAPVSTATREAAAIELLTRLAPRWGATAGPAELVPVGTIAVPGGDVVRVAQRVDGVTVYASELRALVSGGTLLLAAGDVVPADIGRDPRGFRVDAATATGRAFDGDDAGLVMRAGATVEEAWFSGVVAGRRLDTARAQRRWYRLGARLEPAWVVEGYVSDPTSTQSRAERVIIAADDGRVLARHDLTVDAFTYRVWADPTDKYPDDGARADVAPHPTGAPGAGLPAFTAPSLVTVDGLNHPPGGGAADPWLPATATQTQGNNVDAYTDINAPDGLSAGDFRATTTSAQTFDITYDTAQDALASTQQQRAAIAQLFYSINWLHDDWYDAGFTEAAGNAQSDNFGRGGADGDVFLAEAQDAANDGERNNANMSTPGDGMSPRMQVYLWSGVDDRVLTIQPTGATPATRGASYGPRSFDLTGTVVEGQDGTGASPNDGCESITNAVAGRIALLARGNCTSKTKAANAQAAGAVGLIIAHNVSGSGPPGLVEDPNVPTAITIPVLSVGFADGVALRSALQAGPVTAIMHRVLGPEMDGSLDTGLVAHEFGHYLHHRLSDCQTRMCAAQSEGWGDFIAMITAARAGDNLRGTYALATTAGAGLDDPYFGLRRAPYSVDLTKNAFTFRMVADGQALPDTHPVNGGGPNSEVHNAGEVWATALWEAYVALQEARGAASFDEVRRKMQRYVVAGLLMTPPNATFTETRTAIIEATRAADPADAAILAAGFARRGLGSCAVSPPRDSSDFVGATDGFEANKGNVTPTEVTLVIDGKCDRDESLDVGETATLTVPLVNAGTATIDGVTIAVTSAAAGLQITTPSVTIGSMAPAATAMATFQVSLAGGDAAMGTTVDVLITTPGSCSETRTVTLPLRLTADDQARASANDSMDATQSAWVATGDAFGEAWTQEAETALDLRWAGHGLGFSSDNALESPALIAGTGPVTIAFDHSYEFEFTSDTFWDGGMIEITTDDGVNWRDVSELIAVPYDGPLSTESENPQGGRLAFGDTNPSFPATDRLVLDFGTRLSGQTFKLRFRVATDAAISAPGWRIDDVVTTGLTNQPFAIVVADGGACTEPPPGDDGGCCSTGGGPGGALLAGGAVAALLARRRRRGAR